MQGFLSKLAETVVQQHGTDLSRIALVFPTRRAGLFFKKELAARLQGPAWSPRIFAIQDFMVSLSESSIPDSVTLLFELFSVYRNYFPDEPFERFYPWGEVMLRDFEEIDRNLVDAEKIFTLVSDLRSIDAAFALEEDDLERFRGFWKNFFGRELSGIKSEFLHTWKNLLPIYRDFRKKLQDKGQAYEGLAYRLAAEQLRGDGKPAVEFDSVIFAGLYALSKSEEAIIEHFVDQGIGATHWDTDRYYLDDPAQEAGYFLRSSPLFREPRNWVGDDLLRQPKSFEVASIPLEVGQAKYAGDLLAGWVKEMGFLPERTAVVLPDEHLLFPVLYSIPEDFPSINVTMGYPLRLTPLYRLLESLIALVRNRRSGKEDAGSYYFRDVEQILGHPYVRLLDPEGLRDWQQRHRDKRWIRISESVLRENVPPFFSRFFKKVEGMPALFAWFREILRAVLEAMQEQEFRFHRLESEFVFHFHKQLSRLEELVRDLPVEQSLETFWTLFREVVHSARIPFTGEPLSGLQVMGFLETRVLDFDNIIVLSVNEQSLPSGGQHPSFIPFNLRKAFRLPTQEEQHAVSAYHFYRMLQRARRVVFTYNTESKGLTSGEPSRFLLQLEHELVPRSQGAISWERKVITTPIRDVHPLPVTVRKDADVLDKLQRYATAPGKRPEASARFSASALSTYIACPLRFYFRYVAGLQETEEAEENLEAATFGSVLHRALQNLYKTGKRWEAAGVRALRKRIEEQVDEALHHEFISSDQLEGKNILLRNVIVELTGRILEKDEAYAPFEILGLEEPVEGRLALDDKRTVHFHGFIDRLDRGADGVRIIDYKTGRVKLESTVDTEALFSDPAAKEQFQATLYAWMVLQGGAYDTVKAALFTLREMREGVRYLNDGEAFSSEQLNEFEERLRTLIREILDPDVPFAQTDDEDRCKYCPFREICNR
ncbi:MAG: PD-(D/E)XK nuclease family protein [Bacteroidota bacterium]